MNALDALLDRIIAMFSSSNKCFPWLYYEVALLMGVQIGPTKWETFLAVSTKAKHKHPGDPGAVTPSSLPRNIQIFHKRYVQEVTI